MFYFIFPSPGFFIVYNFYFQNMVRFFLVYFWWGESQITLEDLQVRLATTPTTLFKASI